MIEIRPATLDDAAGIARVAEAVRYRRDTADSTRGYLVNVHTAEEYRRRIEQSDCALVASGPEGIAGFLIMTRWHSHHLLDQMAVLPSLAGQGIGQRLYEALCDILKPQHMIAEVMHHPVLNQRSRDFFAKRNGWVLVREVPEGEFLWGLYEWRRRPV
jgi:GNAT superfamily N-acetyltransferase